MITQSDDYIKVFCNIIKSIQNASGREQVLGEIVENAVQVMQAKAGSLFLIKSRVDDDGLFYPAAKIGLSDDYITIGPAKGRDITRDIVMKGGYLAAYDATTDPRLENHEAKKKEGIASLLVVPVIAEKDPIGILARKRLPFSNAWQTRAELQSSDRTPNTRKSKDLNCSPQ
jgi:GAF domain-containing protein